MDGFAAWDRDGGSVSAQLTRGGVPDCHESRPIVRDGSMVIEGTRNGLHAGYGADFLGTNDALRTRCPGPGSADATAHHALATGTLPLSALRRRRVTFRLTQGPTFRGDGLRGQVHPDITIVLRRVSLRERIVVQREPEFDTLPKRLLRR